MGHCIPVNFIVPYELFQKILSDYPKANEINQFRLGFRSFLFIIIHNFVVVFFFNVLLQIENVQHMYIWKGRMLDVLWHIYIYALYNFLNVIELRMRDDTFLQIQIVV